MPRDNSLHPRLAELLEGIFSSSLDDAPAVLKGITAELKSSNIVSVQKKLCNRLREKRGISTTASMLVACVLHRTGFRPQRIMHFISIYLPSVISVAQYQFLFSSIFNRTAPIPGPILYDITQYTYLEKKLLAKKSVEIALKLNKTPAILLFLYLLSLREDLSNENVELILLVLKTYCPSFKPRERGIGISHEEYEEIQEAYRTAQKKKRITRTQAGVPVAAQVAEKVDKDSASYFLDKYFSDEALARQIVPGGEDRLNKAQNAEKTGAGAGSGKKDVSSSTRGGTVKKMAKPAPVSDRGKSGRKKKASGAAAFLRKPAIALGVPAALAVLLLLLFLVLLPLLRTASPAESADVNRHAAEASQEPPSPAPAAAPPASSAQASATAGQPSESVPPSYTVRGGDSLWKIYLSLKQAGKVTGSWQDFLHSVPRESGIGDPDLIYPGETIKVP
jgi:nucleoid-associated protein YgaU